MESTFQQLVIKYLNSFLNFFSTNLSMNFYIKSVQYFYTSILKGWVSQVNQIIKLKNLENFKHGKIYLSKREKSSFVETFFFEWKIYNFSTHFAEYFTFNYRLCLFCRQQMWLIATGYLKTTWFQHGPVQDVISVVW